MSADWTPAMARRDAADQVEEANAAARDEVSSQRNADWADIYDERQPTRAELEADDYDDWAWARDQQRRTT